MRRWLGRLAFSFIVVAAALVWEGKRAADAGKPAWFFYAGAAVLGTIGLAGLRERHRPWQ